MKKLRYPCLILDHDDTVVDSTACLHWPAFLEGMALLRPGTTMTLDEYFAMNCDPGIFRYYAEVAKLTPEETAFEKQFWLNYIAGRVPHVYPGMKQVIRRQKALGGAVCVVSHSNSETILRDYRAHGLPEPDLIYGGERPEAERKPLPFPVEDILARLGCQKSEALVVDDLLTGQEMAAAAGVDLAAACWAHHVPAIRQKMERAARYCCLSPADLYKVLFGEALPAQGADA